MCLQVASTTLDASAKIYAGRVDAIHAETYKVLSGLGRGADKQKQSEGKQSVGICKKNLTVWEFRIYKQR